MEVHTKQRESKLLLSLLLQAHAALNGISKAGAAHLSPSLLDCRLSTTRPPSNAGSGQNNPNQIEI